MTELATSRELRRMSLTGLSQQQRDEMRDIIERAADGLDPEMRPDLAEEFREVLILITEVDQAAKGCGTC